MNFLTDGTAIYLVADLPEQDAADLGCPGATHKITGRHGYIIGTIVVTGEKCQTVPRRPAWVGHRAHFTALGKHRIDPRLLRLLKAFALRPAYIWPSVLYSGPHPVIVLSAKPTTKGKPAMATRTYTEYVDDLTGIAADDVQPVEFSFEGKAYVIDLSDEHRDDFRAHLSVFIAKARPLTKASSRPRAATGGASRNDLPAIRAWAQLLGHNVRQRGRIPAEIIAAYDAAH